MEARGPDTWRGAWTVSGPGDTRDPLRGKADAGVGSMWAGREWALAGTQALRLGGPLASLHSIFSAVRREDTLPGEAVEWLQCHICGGLMTQETPMRVPSAPSNDIRNLQEAGAQIHTAHTLV